MGINMQRKELNLNKCSINQNVSSWIEQDIIVPDSKPDAIKIVGINVTPYVSDVESLDGKIKVTGKLNYFVIYKVNDEKFNTRGLFMTYPYSEILEVNGMSKDMDINVCPTTKNVIYSLPNERKIAVRTEIMFKIRGKSSVCVSLIKKFDNDNQVECKMCNGVFNNIIQSKKSTIVSKEDIMLPKEAEDFFEILDIDARVRNTEYKESYNKIMVKGDIEVKLVYITENAEDEVKKVNISIPFTAMVELENISDRSKFDIKYMLQDFNIRLNEDITSTKTMTADYQIEVEVTMYEEENDEYVEDFYSQTKELTFENKSIEIVKRSVSSVKKIESKENIIGIIPSNCRLVDYKLDTSNVLINVNQLTANLEGNAKVMLLLQNLESMDLEEKTVEVLVNESFDIDGYMPGVRVNIDIFGSDINVTQDGSDIDLRIILEMELNIEDATKLNVVDMIEEGILDLSNLDSINIYVVKPGDTLWNIAKKYKTSVEKIVKTNNIDDPNNIDVGQKILIIR